MSNGTEWAARTAAAGRRRGRCAGSQAAIGALLVAALTCAAVQPAVAAADGARRAAATAGTAQTGHGGGVTSWNFFNDSVDEVPPEARSGVKSVSVNTLASAQQHALALKEDGRVIAWGDNGSGQATVPAEAATGAVAVAAGETFSMALKSDGRTIVWGYLDPEQRPVPEAATSGVDAIAAGDTFALALKDGGVIAWGNLPGEMPPAAKTGVTAISAASVHALAVKTDGSVVAWGENSTGAAQVPPAAQTGVVAVAAGVLFSLALKKDGSVIAWGGSFGKEKVLAPAGSGVRSISAGTVAAVMVHENGSVSYAGDCQEIPPPLNSGVTVAAVSQESVLLVRNLAAPEVTSPRQDSVTGTLRPDFTGKGLPGATITVRDGDRVLARGTVGEDGTWTATPQEDLAPGRLTVSVDQSQHGVASPTVQRSFTALAPLPAKGLSEIVLADFTGDGKADVIAKTEEAPGLHLFKGRGDGTFEPGTKVFDDWDYTQTTAGDFDGDGAADLVATDPSGTLHLWRGKGDGAFAERKKLTGWAGKEQTTAGDVDGDGVTDLVALDAKDHTLKLWKGTKEGSGNPFARPRNLTKWAGFEQSSLGDLDGKGLAHLIAARTDPKTGKTGLRLWKSKGDVPGNPFEKPHQLTGWADFTHTTLGDVDGNRTADLMAVDNKKNQLKIWKSNGRIDANPFAAPLNVSLYLAP
ncbi:FG-GAP-like repeat-containing protein [Streptomyces sp. NPDC089919]|uniref:FG-GAP-like repeat-containing protein n=1 Tax=Streptomyces sp. NPDC089919 TaxID=3155188 RepID=UPI003430B373